MTGPTTIIGPGLLCTLAISVIAAQGASAVGTTANTCVSVEKGTSTTVGFADAHCKTPAANDATQLENVKVEDKSVPNSTTTESTFSNETTGGLTEAALRHSVQSGVEEEIKATGLHATGWVEHKESGGEMYVHGEATLSLTGVTILRPAGKGCKILGEKL